MKKILISLSIIGVVAAIGIGATIAYYNDTETSTGNILVAGTMDLKVDHKYAMYDGNECVKDCVENPSVNLIQNGSFEVPEVTDPAKWEIFQSGASGLIWTVEWAGSQTSYGGYDRPAPALVEYHEGVLGNAQDGDQYAELDSDWFGPNHPLNGEPALVKIYQNIPTTPGAKYKLHYYFSPRPNTGSGENILNVEIDDVLAQTVGPVAGGGSILWTEYTKEFTATNASTKVEFIGGGTDNSLGIFLDNVSVHPYNCTYQITGGTCTLWDLKDLGQGDYYWHYGDVKPGDYGVNIISLHAYNNDAYACIMTHDIVDLDNTLVDPELALGDTLATGELSPFIKIFAWEDINQNNIYDDGPSSIIVGPNVPLTTAIGKIPLTASNTKYVGLAWCAGTQTVVGNIISCDGSSMGNIAQTDSFTASITAYAEQQRNNENFVCPNWNQSIKQ
ncbi:MAG: SipW-dependent-type signal peptide-containing protein [Candidatus Nealsonbacteria bacterium]|nr:SipW-dependent-type signal peptide-containing protein [Candidatus Nealsonbacteria bacterium]